MRKSSFTRLQLRSQANSSRHPGRTGENKVSSPQNEDPLANLGPRRKPKKGYDKFRGKIRRPNVKHLRNPVKIRKPLPKGLQNFGHPLPRRLEPHRQRQLPRVAHRRPTVHDRRQTNRTPYGNPRHRRRLRSQLHQRKFHLSLIVY